MASDRSSKPSPTPKPAGRSTPVLVPQGALEGQPEIPLNRPVTTVGSNENARLHLLSRTVSKGHALFINSGGGTYVADMASRTGVLVNGKLVTDAELKSGDRVQIGKFVFRYRPASGQAATQPIQAPPAAVIVVGWPALPVTGRVVSIGRGERSDIALNTDSAVSAPHAAIFQVDGKWYIRDMNSRTGTIVNGKPIHQSPLNFGDRIVIGSSTILFQPGAAIEDEFFQAEPEQLPEEITGEITEEFPQEIPEPMEAIAPVADEAPIPLADDEPIKTGDWKSAFPVAEEAPLEVPFADESPIEIAPEPPVAATPASPLDYPAEHGDAGVAATEIEPIEDAIDWSATPATELPLEVPFIDESPIEIAPEPTVAATPASPLDSPAEHRDAGVAATEIEPVADAIDWAATPATELPLEVPFADESPIEIAPEPTVAATPASPLDYPAEHGDAGVAATEIEPIEDAIDWSATPATELPLEVPFIDESPIEIAQEPTVAATPASPLDSPAEHRDAGVAATEIEPIEDAIDWSATPATELPLEVPFIDESPIEIAQEPTVAATPASPLDSPAEHRDAGVAATEIEPIEDAIDWSATPATELPLEVPFIDESPIEIAQEPTVAATPASPLDYPAEHRDAGVAATEIEPVEDAIDWSATPATELPLEVPFIDESPIEIAPEPPVAATPASPLDSPAEHGDAGVAATEIEPVADAIDWAATPATELPLEVPFADESPIEIAPEPTVAATPASPLDSPAEHRDAGVAATEIEPIEDAIDWSATPATELPLEVPFIDESPIEIAQEPTVAATPASPLDYPAEHRDAGVAATEIEPVAVEALPLGELPLALEPEPIADVIDWNAAPANESPTEIISEPLGDVDWNAAPATELPVDEIAPVESPSGTESPLEVEAAPLGNVDWSASIATDLPLEESATIEPAWSADSPAEEIAELTPIAPEPSPTFDAPSEVEAESLDGIDWNPTPTDETPDLEPIAVEPAPLDGNMDWHVDLSTEQSTAVAEALPELAEEIATSVHVDPHEVEQPATETEPETHEQVSWNATPATELPVETISPAQSVTAEVPPVLPVAQVQSVAIPPIDPQAPVEDFVFVPAAEAVDPNAIPDVLFWGDPELDAVAEQAVIPPVVEPPHIEPVPVEAPVAEVVHEPIEPAPVESPSVESIEEIPLQDEAPSASTLGSTFDTVLNAAFTQVPAIPAALPDVAEELSIPEGLAAFSKASQETAESYVEDASIPQPAEDFLDTITPEPESADSAIGFDTLTEPHQPKPDLDVVDAEWSEVKEEPINWSAEINHDDLRVDDSTTLTDLSWADEVGEDEEQAIGWTALPDQDEPIAQGNITVTQPLTSGEPDLDFLDFEDETPQPTAETVEPEAPQTPAPAAESPAADPRGPAHGPSIFGFQFEGGSFLGGMPISLHQAGAPAPEAPAAPATVFDAGRVTPSGLGTMTPPPAPAPPVTARPPRPMTPPRPDRAAAAAAPSSLTGLISDARTPWSSAPVIPPTARTDSRNRTGPRKPLTTSFNGQGAAPRTTEVFSQLAAPIGVEVFGGKPGNPDQFTVPDSKETAAEAAAAVVAAPAPAVAPLPRKRRRSRLPWLVPLFVAVPAGIWSLIYLCPPVSSHLVSAKLMGSLQFDGLTTLNDADIHAFHVTQEARLYSEDVRSLAQIILENKNQPAGFTGSDEDFSKTVDSQSLNWSGNTLQFTFNTTDPKAGTAQVNAVLAALAQKDRDLDDAKARAKADLDNARAAADDAAARLQRLTEERRVQLDKATDAPDPSIVSTGDQDAATLTQKYNDAKAIRQSNEAVLADLRSKDPSKPINIEEDPQIVELQKRLTPLTEQITRLKGINAVASKSTATSQPDADTDPLLAPLQQESDLLKSKLEQRRAELAADAAMSPQQREVNMASRIENLSVKITAMQKVESEAKAAADAANAKAKQNHDRTSAARLASVKAEELYAQITELDSEHGRLLQAQGEKESALANCVTVSQGPIAPPAQLPTTDLRPPTVALGAGLSCVIFGLMIAGELRRPKLIKSVKPAAAPLVHPPVKVIPWPNQKELSGLDADPQVPQGDPDQVFGV